MKPLKDFVQFGRFIIGAIKLAKISERFTTHRRILFDAHPEFFGLARQLPFRCEPRKRKLAFRFAP